MSFTPTNPYEPPREAGEPKDKPAKAIRFDLVFLIGVAIALGLVWLWIESAAWGW
jgi:hypothetical protein